MDKTNRLLRAACAVLTAALMAGCAAYLAVRAFGFEFSGLGVYAIALYGATLAQFGRRGTVWSVMSAAGILIPCAFLLAARADDVISALRAATGAGTQGDLAPHVFAAVAMALLLALLLSALFALLLRARSGPPFALLVLLAAVICAMAMNEQISLWATLPGLIGGVIAFALCSGAHREGVRPILLFPATLLAVLALLLSPAARTTWEPLEELATRIRAVTRDYMHFTEERLAFSINEKGYDHAGMIDDNVVAMLGGAADPSEDIVMRVETNASFLLRGTIKRSYTGYSWVDDQAKARYLYYDFLHSGVRDQVFDAKSTEDINGFTLHSAKVEMLENGTSTLFVPGQMAQFEMGLEDAVYYNSAGEIFLTREVAPGDQYAFSARTPDSDEALIAACAQTANLQDGNYATALADYTALPDGIDSRIYAMAVELTQNSENAAEKALAIQNYLAQNYRYTLDGSYPEQGKDFVSWFLLESGEGYCSYFASAMAVLCRALGMPARYVEGYYVRANESGETIVSGKNAHAWTEVYLNGLGWIAFDPTARCVENGADGQSENDGMDSGNSTQETSDDAPEPPDEEPVTTPTPTPPIDDGAQTPDDAPTPTPEPEDNPTFSNEPPNGQDAPRNSDAPEQKKNHIWLWLLLGLLLLALIALAILWMRKRLAASDPLKLCAATRSGNQAAMILYRGILTLLLQIGMVPMNGETPEVFARRACVSIPNPAYLRFVADVACSRYSMRSVERTTLEDGRKAYVVFLNNLRRSERLRFHIHRALHGLGSFENIP